MNAENKIVTVTLDADNIKVTITGPEDFVRSEVDRLTKRLTSKNQETVELESADIPPADEAQMDERQILAAKQPTGHADTVAVFAFAMKYHQKMDEFTEDDMFKCYIRARLKPPKSVGQALRDAKNKADLIEYGSKRGTYRLSKHGERTVRFDLPRS